MQTLLIELTHEKAASLLQDLEEMKIIRVLKTETDDRATHAVKLSQKYRGMLTAAEGEQLKVHSEKMRAEWSSI